MAEQSDTVRYTFPIGVFLSIISGVVWFIWTVYFPDFQAVAPKIATLSADHKYEEMLQLIDKTHERFPDMYWSSDVGYFHAEGMKAKGQAKESLELLEQYIKNTTANLHPKTDRLQADNLIALDRKPEALEVLVKMFKAMPIRNIEYLNEMATLDSNFDPHSRLDPKADELAYDVVTAAKMNQGIKDQWTGVVTLPQSKAVHLDKSLYFQVDKAAAKSEGDTTVITGVILSNISVSKLEIRIQGRNDKDIFLDEKDCSVSPVDKAQQNAFSCTLQDPGPVTKLTVSEIKYGK